jgi:hypothetical protein
VLKALKKAPVDRYVTVNAFSEDLERWLRGEPVQAQPDSRWYRMRRFVGRNRAGVATAAGVLALVLVFSAVSLRQAQIAREQTRLAQTEAKTAQAVQNFLEGIFQASNGNQPDPIQARQRTAKQLLDEGAARIQTELDDAPAAKLRVLVDAEAILFDQMGDLDATLPPGGRSACAVPHAYFGNDFAGSGLRAGGPLQDHGRLPSGQLEEGRGTPDAGRGKSPPRLDAGPAPTTLRIAPRWRVSRTTIVFETRRQRTGTLFASER